MRSSRDLPPWNDALALRLNRFPVFSLASEQRTETTEHRQAGLEINLTCRGRGVLYVDELSIPLSAGVLVIIPEGRPHRLAAESGEPYTRSVLCVGSGASRRISNSVIHRPEFLQTRSASLSPGNLRHFQMLITLIAEEARLHPPCWEENCLALAEHLLVLALRARNSEGESYTTLRLTQKVAKYVTDHLDESLTTARIAKEFGVSREHLGRVFSQDQGVPLGRFILASRMAAARRALVENPDWTILDVALAVGFQSHAHFSRLFREVEGVTPSAFRTLYRIG